MEKQEKGPINKTTAKRESHREVYFDPQNFLEDMDLYKLSEEIRNEASAYDSEKEAVKMVKERYAEALGEEDPLIQKYEEAGPLQLEELKKKHNEELRSVGLDLEDITIYSIEKDEDSETEDIQEKKEIIYIKDYKKFVNYLKQLDLEKISGAEVKFLDSVLGYLTDGIKEYYDTRKSDERLEELLLASKDIINEYKRFDKDQQVRMFPRFRELEDHILAARGEYLREFNFLTENLYDIPSLEEIWDSKFDKDLYIKTLDNVYKRIDKIKKNENALKNRNSIYLIRDYEEKFHKDLEFVHSLLVKNSVENPFVEHALALLTGRPNEKVLKEVTEHLEDFLKKLR